MQGRRWHTLKPILALYVSHLLAEWQGKVRIKSSPSNNPTIKYHPMALSPHPRMVNTLTLQIGSLPAKVGCKQASKKKGYPIHDAQYLPLLSLV